MRSLTPSYVPHTKKANGCKGHFGMLNLRAGDEVTVEFSLRDAKNELVAPPSFHFSVFDFDAGNDPRIREYIEIDSREYTIRPAIAPSSQLLSPSLTCSQPSLAFRYDEYDLDPHTTISPGSRFNPLSSANYTTFVNHAGEGNIKNPVEPEDLNAEQQAVTNRRHAFTRRAQRPVHRSHGRRCAPCVSHSRRCTVRAAGDDPLPHDVALDVDHDVQGQAARQLHVHHDVRRPAVGPDHADAQLLHRGLL